MVMMWNDNVEAFCVHVVRQRYLQDRELRPFLSSSVILPWSIELNSRRGFLVPEVISFLIKKKSN